ncbi:ABC transporter ATP-binding protein [Roseospirillum parvum]|uniref:ABC-2 type transport system ATP-binding protein n=1 Tax=Roseospirillum parvum TaxID=83401 RepID=A0A1G7TTB1_9PROT|nr:ABC transporter ATP-binding protein [Roseospirillum parvum]SDG38508.1 ABC-2 type transport system ATP-binding protein [Roseospirillum parvum]
MSIPPLPDNAISLRQLTKTYKGEKGRPGRRALDAVDLDVPRGAFFGLLGPNGAGKSTLINILAGLVRKTAGEARIWDRDIVREERAARCAIGIVPQELNLDPFFTPRELLEMQAGLYGVPPRERRTEEILDAVGLGDKADAYARTLSGGMRRRLLVAKAMVHSPPVLILDEPTAGVDIELRRQLWDHVRELNRQGTTILLTTHYLEEAEELCDRIAIINHGRVVACDSTPALLRRFDNKTMTLTLKQPLDALPAPLAALGAELREGGSQIHLAYRAASQPVDQILEAVRQSGLSIHDLSTEEADLEDIFLQVTRADNAATNGQGSAAA